MTRFETDRLIIMPVSFSDLSDIYEVLSDSNSMTYFVEGTYSLDQVKQFIQEDLEKMHQFSVFLKETGKWVGKLSFHPWFMKDTYEIGWIFSSQYTSYGYCTEASKAILDYGFKVLNLHRIVATCQPENIASKRVCEKLGMRLEGLFKKCIYYKNDIWWDELFYAILKEDYL